MGRRARIHYTEADKGKPAERGAPRVTPDPWETCGDRHQRQADHFRQTAPCPRHLDHGSALAHRSHYSLTDQANLADKVHLDARIVTFPIPLS